MFAAQERSSISPCPLAVLRHERDAVLDRVARRAHAHLLAAHADRPRVALVGAEDGAQRLRPARADEPGDAEDLALAHPERDRVRAAAEAQPLDPQQLRVAARRGVAEVRVVHPPADHQPHDAGGVDLRDPPGGRHRAVAHHRHAVGQREDLVEVVGDEDHGDPAGAQAPDDAEERLDLGGRQRRRRLVEDQQAAVARERLGDLDELHLRDPEVLDQRRRRHLELDELEELAGPAVQCPAVDEPPAPRKRLDEEVLRDAEVRQERELLVHDPDARGQPVLRAGRGVRGPRHHHRPLVGQIHARDGLDEARLPGAVLAHERVDLARGDRPAHPVERDDPGKSLGDAGDLEDRRLVRRGHGGARRPRP
jgi:hypothetical protein